MDKIVFWGRNRRGGEVLLGAPSSMELRKDKGAADLLTALFPAADIWENLTSIQGYLNEKLFFSGICDEQTVSCGSGGMTAEIVARSLAALLIDNEVMPQTLRNPSLSFISRHFTEPLGLRIAAGEEDKAAGELVVQKGTSVMNLLRDYSGRSSLPAVTATGEILFDPPRKVHRPQNLLEWQVTQRNCDVLSEVFVQSSLSGTYSVHFVNPEAEGIMRRRYKNSGWDFTGGRRIKVAVAGFASIDINDELFIPQGLCGLVTGVRVTGNKNGFATVITAEETESPAALDGAARKGKNHVDI